MNEVPLKSIWQCIAGSGAGLNHIVLSISSNKIATWSELDKNPNNGGYSFYGSKEQFLEEFRRVK